MRATSREMGIVNLVLYYFKRIKFRETLISHFNVTLWMHFPFSIPVRKEVTSAQIFQEIPCKWWCEAIAAECICRRFLACRSASRQPSNPQSPA